MNMARDAEAAGTRVERKRRARSAAFPWSKLVGLGFACLSAELGKGGGGGGLAEASWIDPDTLPEYRTKDFEGDDRKFDLVFSDEFNRYLCGVCAHGRRMRMRLMLEQKGGTHVKRA